MLGPTWGAHQGHMCTMWYSASCALAGWGMCSKFGLLQLALCSAVSMACQCMPGAQPISPFVCRTPAPGCAQDGSLQSHGHARGAIQGQGHTCLVTGHEITRSQTSHRSRAACARRGHKPAAVHRQLVLEEDTSQPRVTAACARRGHKPAAGHMQPLPEGHKPAAGHKPASGHRQLVPEGGST